MLVAERNNFICNVHGGFSCVFVKGKNKKQGVVLPQREWLVVPESEKIVEQTWLDI